MFFRLTDKRDFIHAPHKDRIAITAVDSRTILEGMKLWLLGSLFFASGAHTNALNGTEVVACIGFDVPIRRVY